MSLNSWNSDLVSQSNYSISLKLLLGLIKMNSLEFLKRPFFLEKWPKKWLSQNVEMLFKIWKSKNFDIILNETKNNFVI